jgi:sugar phosphate isomerase/epimerase
MAEATGAQLKVFHSLWGFSGDWHEAIARAKASGFSGLEVNLLHPSLADLEPLQAIDALKASQLDLVVELISGGDYVPDLAISPAQHVAELAEQLPRAECLQPERITLITGSDSWSDAVQDRFLEEVLNLVEDCSCPVSLETHRSRCLFNPWTIADRLERHPRLRLTADLSHWCAVSERLMTPELELISTMADRVDHIHARVGHAQGPSVSHPFAPEARDALEAHRRCWALFVEHQRARGVQQPTITPEFGPDGYLPTLPFTCMPVADLLEINTAMAQWLKQGALNR